MVENPKRIDDTHTSNASLATVNTEAGETVISDPEPHKYASKSMDSIEINEEETKDPEPESNKNLLKFILNEQSKMGPFSFKEGLMLFSFVLLVVAWLLRDPKFFDGWGKHPFANGVSQDGNKVSVYYYNF